MAYVTRDELAERARNAGLSDEGTRDELIARLSEVDSAVDGGGGSVAAVPPADDEDPLAGFDDGPEPTSDNPGGESTSDPEPDQQPERRGPLYPPDGLLNVDTDRSLITVAFPLPGGQLEPAVNDRLKDLAGRRVADAGLIGRGIRVAGITADPVYGPIVTYELILRRPRLHGRVGLVRPSG